MGLGESSSISVCRRSGCGMPHFEIGAGGIHRVGYGDTGIEQRELIEMDHVVWQLRSQERHLRIYFHRENSKVVHTQRREIERKRATQRQDLLISYSKLHRSPSNQSPSTSSGPVLPMRILRQNRSTPRCHRSLTHLWPPRQARSR
jgi:hypothetical protein